MDQHYKQIKEALEKKEKKPRKKRIDEIFVMPKSKAKLTKKKGKKPSK